MENGAERSGNGARATARHTPTPSHQTPLLLLRFSAQVREELEAWESDPTAHQEQTRETPAHPPHQAWRTGENEWGQAALDSTQGQSQFRQQRRSRKVRRWFVGLLLFCLGAFVAVSLGLLELRYRQQTQEQALVAQRSVALKTLARALHPKAKSHTTKWTIHPAISTFEKTYTAIVKAHKRHCQGPAPAPATTASTAAKAEHYVRDGMQRWQVWLWQQLGHTYVAQRKKLWASTKPLVSHAPLCQVAPKRLGQRAQRLIHKYHKRLLAGAAKHIAAYGWCQRTWSQVAARPVHYEWLQKLRQRKCKALCTSRPKVPGTACTTCLRQWRNALGLDTARFQRYHSLVTRSHQNRCHTWSGKPAHNGVFHLGEYYWRVAQVLAHTRWLTSQKRCDASCRKLRRKWGTQLRLTSQPAASQIYLRLWSSRVVAPTPQLAKLAQLKLGQSGKKPLWIPALRLAKNMPRDAWFLLQAYHPKSKRRTYLAILPKPAQTLKVHLKLFRQQLHNDGRQPVRHPTIASDGSKLAFLTYRMTPWEPQPLFAAPYCWRAPSQVGLSWRAAISLYPLTIKGQPRGQGQHLYTTQWLREIRLVKRGAQLLVSAPRSPASMTPPAANTDAAPRAGLWQLDLSMSLGLAGKRARALTPLPQPGHIDLPVASASSTLLLRRACALAPGTAGALQLLQVPATTPPQVIPPPGHQVVHAAQNSQWFALLLHPKGRRTGSALALFSRRTAAIAPQPTRLLRLRVRHRQIVGTRDGFLFAGGDWGSPLQSWTAKGVQHLTASDPSVRYLDPIRHPQSQRLFVIQQRRALGAKNPKHHATFLLSWRRLGARP